MLACSPVRPRSRRQALRQAPQQAPRPSRQASSQKQRVGEANKGSQLGRAVRDLAGAGQQECEGCAAETKRGKARTGPSRSGQAGFVHTACHLPPLSCRQGVAKGQREWRHRAQLHRAPERQGAAAVLCYSSLTLQLAAAGQSAREAAPPPSHAAVPDRQLPALPNSSPVTTLRAHLTSAPPPSHATARQRQLAIQPVAWPLRGGRRGVHPPGKIPVCAQGRWQPDGAGQRVVRHGEVGSSKRAR